jgi:hypothetical protein
VKGDKSLVLEITVSGVPKKGCFCLKSLDEFRDNLVFDFEHTNKNIIMYNDFQDKTLLTDYQGNELEVADKYGCCLLPTTYELGKSEEYAELLSDESSARSYYK